MTTPLTAGISHLSTPSDVEVAITRVLNVPRATAWDLWNSPRHMQKWLLGPDGWTMPVCEVDLRPGGAWRMTWRKESGTEMTMTGKYIEVTPPVRVVSTERWGGDWPETINTVDFADNGKQTTLTLTIKYPSKAARDAALATGMKGGIDVSFNRLDALVETLGVSAATDARVRTILAGLTRRGSKKNVDGMARYAIVAKHVLGVSVGDLRDLAKTLGKSHELALALWKTGIYEARMLAAFVDERDKVTPAQMDRWAKAFDNWAICDHCCFHLFDKTPFAWAKIEAWSRRDEEFVKRAAFALLASVALHDKKAPDAPFLKALALIDRESGDDRNFVKKAVNWALRGIGRRSPALKTKALALSKKLAASPSSATRWIGKDALRDLSR